MENTLACGTSNRLQHFNYLLLVAMNGDGSERNIKEERTWDKVERKRERISIKETKVNAMTVSR